MNFWLVSKFFWMTDHALKRMQSDGLREEDVRAVIERPLFVAPGRKLDTMLLRGRALDGRIIRVVLESGYRVVTAYVDRNSQEIDGC